MKPVYDRWGVRVFEGDCLGVMRGMESESISAIVTDPPYGLAELPTAKVVKALTEWITGDRAYIPDGKGFMSRRWDRFVPPPAAWDECLRVLKPGGHLLCFSGTRTADLMGISIRLAGFEIQDEIDSIGSRISWMYGVGFPKSRNVSKDIDRMAGAEREVIGRTVTPFKVDAAAHRGTSLQGSVNGDFSRQIDENGYRYTEHTAAATVAASQWDGWGSALKPSHEPILVARKPLDRDHTIAANVLKHGTGALNIDATRVDTTGRLLTQSKSEMSSGIYGNGLNGSYASGVTNEGRWPPNTILSHAPLLDPDTGEVIGDACADGCVEGCAVTELDRQSGSCGGAPGQWTRRARRTEPNGRERPGEPAGIISGYDDTGGASRFFHCVRWEPTPFIWETKAPTKQRPRVAGESHSTVKNVNLMRVLIKLVTPPGGTILDCFAGTGSTGQAARAEGFECILIDDDPKAMELIRARLDALPRTEAPAAEQAPVEGPRDLFDLLGGDVA